MKVDLTRQNFVQSLLTTILLLMIFGGKMLFLWEEVSSATYITEFSHTIIFPPVKNLLLSLSQTKVFSAIILPLILLFNTLYLYRIAVAGGTHSKTGNFVSTIDMMLLLTIPSISLSIIGNIISLLIMLATEQLGRVRNLINCSNHFFMAAIYVGIASLLSVQSIIFVIPIIATLFIGQRFVVKEFICTVIGLLLPFTIYLYISWAINQNIDNELAILSNVINIISLPSTQVIDISNIIYAISSAVVLFIAFLAVCNIHKQRYEMKIRTYNTYTHYLILFLSSIIAIILFWDSAVIMLPTLFISLSLLCAYFIHSRSNRVFRNIAYITFAIISIITAMVN